MINKHLKLKGEKAFLPGHWYDCDAFEIRGNGSSSSSSSSSSGLDLANKLKKDTAWE